MKTRSGFPRTETVSVVMATYNGAEFLDEQLDATVNMNEACNAFSDGFTINFFN